MKRLSAFILLVVLCVPAMITLFSCDRRTDVKQEITDDGQGNRKETTVREFK
jgi:hypothetical protein